MLSRLSRVFSVGSVRRSLSSVSMRLVQFSRPGEEGVVRVGVEAERGNGIVDLKEFDPSMPSSMREFLELGEKGMEAAHRAMSSDQRVIPHSSIRLLAPVTRPDKVVCVGMNYKDHCLEQNAPIPKEPIIFSKFPSAITGPYDNIILPNMSQEVDWEVELAFIIGKKGKDIKEEEAMSYIAGFTIANDVSARDWQMRRNGKQWILGKTFDTFCPLGSALVTTSALKDVHNLGIRCLVNGEVMQDSNTNQLIFKTEKLVAWVSQFVTLYPGDVFLTGTPPGVGVFRNPAVFLKLSYMIGTDIEVKKGTPAASVLSRGDVVECQIDGIGSIRNTVV